MKISEIIKERLGTIWYSWIITSSSYLFLNLAGYPLDLGSYSTTTATTLSHTISYIASFIGLFVPYGLASLIKFLSPGSWLSLIFFVIAMWIVDNRLGSMNISLKKRFFLNLLALLLLTTIVDIIRGTPFMSWIIFLGGGHPSYCC